MSFSPAHGRSLDVGDIGLGADTLPPPELGRINPADWFDADRRDAPIELEIGSGKGAFLVQQATIQPDVNFVGVEWARAFWAYAADRCRRHGLRHVRLLRAEAADLIRDHLPDHCLQQVHIYFPDPWPKKRHHKRRFVNERNLRELWRCLEPGGKVRLATDHEDYFHWMLEHAERVRDCFERAPFERPVSAGDGEVVGTNFERKYRREGRTFHTLCLARREPGPPIRASAAG